MSILFALVADQSCIDDFAKIMPNLKFVQLIGKDDGDLTLLATPKANPSIEEAQVECIVEEENQIIPEEKPNE